MTPPDAPESFAVAMAKIDFEVSDRRDDGTHVLTVLGVEEVRAAHEREVKVLEAECDSLREMNAALIAERDALRKAADEVRLKVAEAAFGAYGVSSLDPLDFYLSVLRAVGCDESWALRSVPSFIDHLKAKVAAADRRGEDGEAIDAQGGVK